MLIPQWRSLISVPGPSSLRVVGTSLLWDTQPMPSFVGPSALVKWLRAICSSSKDGSVSRQGMITKLKNATFSIQLSDPAMGGMNFPTGTGFFVHRDGWFVTARHVVAANDGTLRPDLADAHLNQGARFGETARLCIGLRCDYENTALDFALLKCDPLRHAQMDWFKREGEFPSVPVSKRELFDGDPVYAFGYPLSQSQLLLNTPAFRVSSDQLCPRLTSAMISSNLEQTEMVMSSADIKRYVLDKALNYGNSGGPIASASSGMVHAFCSRFQPQYVPQPVPPGSQAKYVMVPSLYGISVSLANSEIVSQLVARGVAVTAD